MYDIYIYIILYIYETLSTKRKFFSDVFPPIKDLHHKKPDTSMVPRKLGELPGLPLGSLREKLRELLPKDLQQENDFFFGAVKRYDPGGLV